MYMKTLVFLSFICAVEVICVSTNDSDNNGELQDDVSVLKNTIQDLLKKYDILNEKYERQEKLFHQIMSTMSSKDNVTGKKAPGTFGFTAFATDTYAYEIDERIYFNYTASNFGGYFNPIDSEFLCPVSGTYYFVINMQCSDGGYMVRARMILDENTLVATAEIIDASMEHMSSNSAVVACPAGSRVWVKAGARSVVEGGTVDLTTSFSGFLIAADI